MAALYCLISYLDGRISYLSIPIRHQANKRKPLVLVLFLRLDPSEKKLHSDSSLFRIKACAEAINRLPVRHEKLKARLSLFEMLVWQYFAEEVASQNIPCLHIRVLL